jgi:hypothetical protein
MLHSWTKGWLILALLAFFAGFVALTLPFLQKAPGGSIESLDARIFYSPDEAYSTVGSYGDASQFWIRTYLTWDIVNPVIYTLIFGLGLSWLFQRSFSSDSKLQMLNVAPVGAGLFDVLENIFIVVLLTVYPTHLTGVAWLAAVSTLGKTIFLGASAALMLVGLVGATLNRFKKQ